MSAIVFRRGRFLRIAIVAVFLLPVLYLLIGWMTNDAVEEESDGGHTARRIRLAPRLVEGKFLLFSQFSCSGDLVMWFN